MRQLAIGLLLAAANGFAQQFLISTFAGGAPPPTPAAAAATGIGAPHAVAADGTGNVYFAALECVFRVDAKGVLTRIAGTSRAGYSGDGGPGTSASLNYPSGLAIDAAGNIYVADSFNARIRRISPSGVAVTVAGNGVAGFAGDNGPAAAAQLSNPVGLAIDASGNLYVSDSANQRVRRVSPNGIIATVAGNGNAGYAGDGAAATSAQLRNPAGLAVDSAGNLYIADSGNNRIRKVSASGSITTVAGNGIRGSAGDAGAATVAELNAPWSVAIDVSGNLIVADLGNNRIRAVSVKGSISTLAGPSGLNQPLGVASDGMGNLYVADEGDNLVRAISPAGALSTLAGNGTSGFSGDGGPATAAQLAAPAALAADASGNVYIADTAKNRVRIVSAGGAISTLAGQFKAPAGLTLDSSGNLYVADSGDNVVRRIAPGGMAATVAGSGPSGYSGDGAQATAALLNNPSGVAVDGSDNLYIADTANNRVRKVTPAGAISTVAGTGQHGYAGDGASATNALLANPRGLATDRAGNLYIADSGNNAIRKVAPNGNISTAAGNGTFGYSGDGGQAASAQLRAPSGVAVDSAGNLYIADYGNSAVRLVSASGVISTVAGGAAPGYSGDGGPAAGAQLKYLSGVAVDAKGDVYVADTGNNAARVLNPTTRAVTISAVLDAASESAAPITPGKIVVIYGGGLGPSALALNQPANGAFGTQAGGSGVTFNGVPAAMIYAYSGAISAIAPYEIAGAASVQVVVTSASGVSAPFTVPVTTAAPSFFSANATGAGQIAAVNCNATLNDAAHPVRIGDCISLYATGEGQTSPAGVDGTLAPLNPPYPAPLLPVQVTIGGLQVTPVYAGAAPTLVEGLMQIVVSIPPGVSTGGYVPVVVSVGGNTSVNGAAWIAVAN